MAASPGRISVAKDNIAGKNNSNENIALISIRPERFEISALPKTVNRYQEYIGRMIDGL